MEDMQARYCQHVQVSADICCFVQIFTSLFIGFYSIDVGSYKLSGGYE
jgi:hypothetical protein